MTDVDMNEDAIIACVDLVGRSGARDFEIGYLHDDVPTEEAGWYAHCSYQGARLIAEDRRTPSEAAMALAERILAGGACRCGQKVTLSNQPGCRWRLMGARWEPGCDAPPIHVGAAGRGDHAALQRAWATGNRAARRAAARKKP